MDGWKVKAAGLVLASALAVAPARSHPGYCKLTIIGTPVLVVDPSCPSCDGGALDIYLRNDNRGAVRLFLTAGPLTDKNPGLPLNAGLALELLDPSTKQRWPLMQAAGRGARHETGPVLAPNQMLLLRVTVTNVLQEGQWKADLYNRGVLLGSFAVIRPHLPFNVTLEAAKQEAPEIALKWGEMASVTLKNADAITYPISVSLIVKGKRRELPDVTLPPSGTASIAISPDITRPWFDSRWHGAFVDETVDGHLLLTLRPPPCPPGRCTTSSGMASDPSSPSAGSAPAPALDPDPPATPAPQAGPDAPAKLIQVSVQLAYYPKSRQFLYIFLLLLAGAASSLFLGAYVPNQLQRIALKRQLDRLAGRIRDLPMSLASRLRVSVGLELRRLLELLDSSWGFQPGFSAVVGDVKVRLTILEKRLGMVELLGELRLRFEAQRSKSLFPTPMNRLYDDFESAADALRRLEFKDEDVAAGRNLLSNLQAQLENLEDIEKFYSREQGTVTQILNRANELAGKRPREVPDPGKENTAAQKLFNHMFYRLNDTLEEGGRGTAGPGRGFRHDLLPDVDRLSTKMEMLRDCLRLLAAQEDYERIAPNPEPERGRESRALASMRETCEKLAVHLKSQNPEEFEAARRLKREIEEHVLAADVAHEITREVSQEPVIEPRDWARHARWLRGLALPVLLVAAAALLLLTTPWIGIPLALMLLLIATKLGASPDVLAGTLAGMADRRDRRRPRKAVVHGHPAVIAVADRRNIRIQRDISETRVYEATTLRLRMCQEKLNAAVALEDLTPIWDFGHDDLTPEEGWEVVHYFPRPRRYFVKVKFQNRTGRFVADPGDPQRLVWVTDEIVARGSERGVGFWALTLDIVWLLVALVPALLALYTGALDQLRKLDFIPALIAVFMAGFTSDRVKNLLTQKPG